MSLCKHCITGVRHEGTPEGKWETIGGVQCYVATPAGDYPQDKAILFLPDIFGPQLENAQLMADGFAKNGFKVIIPDYLEGGAVAPDAMGGNTGFNLQDWLAEHGAEKTRPPLDKVIAALRESGIDSFGATGYCFGGRYVFDLAFENIIKVAVVSHPSLLQVPADLEKYVETSKAPLLINCCPVDFAFPPKSQAKADELLGGGKFAPGYKRDFYEGCTHGFAVRGDLSDPKVKAGKEGAFTGAVKWFKSHL